MNVILPIIHTNGTSAEMLRDGNLNAYRAVEAALLTIREAEFNARDYHCHPQIAAWDDAVSERRKHVAALQEASDYFMGIAAHAQKHLDECKARRAERNKT